MAFGVGRREVRKAFTKKCHLNRVKGELEFSIQTREIKERQKEQHDKPEVSKAVWGISGHVFLTLSWRLKCGIFTKYESVGI